MAGGTLKQLITREMLGNGRRVYGNKDGVDICVQMARGLRYCCHARHADDTKMHTHAATDRHIVRTQQPL